MLSQMRDAVLKLKPTKCHLLKTEVNFLFFTISVEGILPRLHNVANVLRFPAPTNQKKVRHILGKGSYYRHSIKPYSDRMRPLIDLTNKG